MWLYCCPWYFSPWIAYLSSCSGQGHAQPRPKSNQSRLAGRWSRRRGWKRRRLRGCCRRLASSPSASAAARWRPGSSEAWGLDSGVVSGFLRVSLLRPNFSAQSVDCPRSAPSSPPVLHSCWTPCGWPAVGASSAVEPNWAEMSITWAAAGNLCFVGRWGQPDSRF
jgi:hypothetical protein